MNPLPPFRAVRAGIDRLPARQDAPRHRHARAYVTVVFSGAYEQAAYAGHLRVQAGDLLVQPTFDAHADRMLSAGVELLRLPWRRELTLGGVFGDCPIEDIRRAAARDVCEAVALVETLTSARRPRPRRLEHWSDRLASDLVADTALRIADWADQAGLSREAVSRGFRARFGVNPARFRSELRARAAWASLTGDAAPLAAVAHELGFADQAQMTREVRWFTGETPAAWRTRSTGILAEEGREARTAGAGPHRPPKP
jgi:AraC-like DNA-binding protein